MEDKIKLLQGELGELRVQTKVDLSEHLQTELGGAAEAFYIATTTRELIRAAGLCRELKIDFLVIGSGSKIMISEAGLKGLAIKNRSSSIKIFGIKGKVGAGGLAMQEAFLEVDSGVSLSKLAHFAASQKLGGLQLISGIPGTVGGCFFITPALKKLCQQVKVLSRGTLKVKQPDEVVRGDIILTATMQLKAK